MRASTRIGRRIDSTTNSLNSQLERAVAVVTDMTWRSVFLVKAARERGRCAAARLIVILSRSCLKLDPRNTCCVIIIIIITAGGAAPFFAYELKEEKRDVSREHHATWDRNIGLKRETGRREKGKSQFARRECAK